MSFANVSVREARDKQREGYIYVDVRSIPEFEQGHPEGAVNVPLHPPRRAYRTDDAEP